MSIIFERVPFPLSCDFANVTCQLRIQLTFFDWNACSSLCGTWLRPMFICSQYYMIVVWGVSDIVYHDWFVWGCLRPCDALL